MLHHNSYSVASDLFHWRPSDPSMPRSQISTGEDRYTSCNTIDSYGVGKNSVCVVISPCWLIHTSLKLFRCLIYKAYTRLLICQHLQCWLSFKNTPMSLDHPWISQENWRWTVPHALSPYVSPLHTLHHELKNENSLTSIHLTWKVKCRYIPASNICLK